MGLIWNLCFYLNLFTNTGHSRRQGGGGLAEA